MCLGGGQPTFDASALTKNHRLQPLLTPLRELFEKMDWAESYEAIASFVEPLDQMDPDSFAFRYPVNKKNNDALPKAFMLNVLAFARSKLAASHRGQFTGRSRRILQRPAVRRQQSGVSAVRAPAPAHLSKATVRRTYCPPSGGSRRQQRWHSLRLQLLPDIQEHGSRRFMEPRG
jgi:hypothetical protein